MRLRWTQGTKKTLLLNSHSHQTMSKEEMWLLLALLGNVRGT